VNHTTASCGCSVVAVGAPNSLARRAQEQRTCGKPRCRSGLPKKFTDEECEAWCWIVDHGIPWSINMINKRAMDPTGDPVEYKNLVEFAKAKGMK